MKVNMTTIPISIIAKSMIDLLKRIEFVILSINNSQKRVKKYYSHHFSESSKALLNLTSFSLFFCDYDNFNFSFLSWYLSFTDLFFYSTSRLLLYQFSLGYMMHPRGVLLGGRLN